MSKKAKTKVRHIRIFYDNETSLFYSSQDDTYKASTRLELIGYITTMYPGDVLNFEDCTGTEEHYIYDKKRKRYTNKAEKKYFANKPRKL